MGTDRVVLLCLCSLAVSAMPGAVSAEPKPGVVADTNRPVTAPQTVALRTRTTGPGERPSKGRSWRWDGSVYVRGYYDSNILHYSQRDRDQFHARLLPNKFSIRSVDDWVSDIGLHVGRQRGSRSRGEYRVRLGTEVNWYARNSIRTWLQHDLELRMARRRHSLAVRMAWVPHFYLRDLRNRDTLVAHPVTPTYASADYHSWSTSFEYRFRWALPFDQEVGGGWKRIAYNSVFSDRDNRTWWGTYGWVLPFHRAWEANWTYRYATIAAAGRQSGAAIIDVSRREYEIGAGLEHRWSPRLASELTVSHELERYTTDRSGDREHFKRRDHQWQMDAELRLSLPRDRWCRILVTWTQATTNRQNTSEFGAYDNTQIGMRLSQAW